MTRPQGFPDFFIIGAPRCGTTSLSRYLMRHPQVCFSRPKETHYFAQLKSLPSEDDLKRDYIDRYFAHRSAGESAAGEGSVSYIYLPGAIEHILNFNADAKFIAMVRNPRTMLPSYHQKMLFLLQENEADFDRAWALQTTRSRGKSVPRTCLDPRLLDYTEVAKLGVQVQRLFDIVGRERAHIMVFDDFVKDTLTEYRAVLDFLELDYDGQTEFERRFESQMYRYRWLQHLFFVTATRGGKFVDTLERSRRKYRKDGTIRPNLIKRITKLNKGPAKPAPLSPQMVDILGDVLHDDIQLLGQLLQRDLGFWLTADQTGR
ncbi:MAG: sulfotransferase [Lysobacterales bacterium]